MNNQTIIQRLSQQQPDIIIKAPGRINLIGEHTDYNNGFVMPASIDKAIYFSIKKSNENKLQFKSLDYNDDYFLPIELSSYDLDNAKSWMKYMVAILLILKEKGYKYSAFNCEISGDIPIGAGLSSSAALCCGFIFGLSELNGWNISRKEIALMGQATEHRIGLNCGIMDQFAVLFGQENKVINLDCQDLSFDYASVQLDGYSLVMINSGVKHELAGESGYNDRRAACERVVARVQKEHSNVKTLRDIDHYLLEKYRNEVLPLDFQRAKYVLDENERVGTIKSALLNNDVKRVGETLFRAHEAMSKEYEITTSELDLLVDLAKQHGILGARMMGGGFGGCTINLVPTAQKEVIVKEILHQYKEKTNISAEVHDVKIGQGVTVI